MRLKLKQLLDDLKFRGMADVLDTELDRCLAERLSYEDLLYNLLSEEHRARQERGLPSQTGPTPTALVSRNLSLRQTAPA